MSSGNGSIRVLVVEDSATVRATLVNALEEDPRFEVVGEAGDGRAAIQLCERLRPSVMTLDLVLPERNGIQVIERVMARCPTPILIVSASDNRRDVFDVLDALQAGAVDWFEKSLLRTDAQWRPHLLSLVALVSRIRVIGRRGSSTRMALSLPPSLPCPAPKTTEGPGPRIVALGASMGGPRAVATILRALPPDFAIPRLVVIHLASVFGEFMAEWLDRQASRPVRLVKDGEAVPGRSAGAETLLAPPDRHVVLRGGRLRLIGGPERCGCRPSVDVLFESLAQELGPRAIGCLLTGMGKDGAAGLLRMRQAGAATIVQNEETCAMFGMPREAIQLDAAQEVIPLGEIAAAISRLALHA